MAYVRQSFFKRFRVYANLEDSDDGPEKGVEIFPATFTKTGHHFAAVALASVVCFQRAELPAKQIHP